MAYLGGRLWWWLLDPAWQLLLMSRTGAVFVYCCCWALQRTSMYGSELVLFGKGEGGRGCIFIGHGTAPYGRADDASQENEKGRL